MKSQLLLFLILVVGCKANAQNVGIGTTTPNASAKLEVASTSKGVLVPRMTIAQRNAIATPATGLLIFQTDGTAGFYYYTGTAWTAIAGGGSLTGWSTTGNSGTDSLVNFVGTTDNKPLVFKVNNTKAGLLGNNGNVFWGKGSGISNTTGTNNTAIGNDALSFNEEGIGGVAIGDSALFTSQANYNTGVGSHALFNSALASKNTASGAYSLYNNTKGSFNVANGVEALYHNFSGGKNIAVGNQSLYSNSTGYNNTAVGDHALFNNNNGNYLVAIGDSALYSNNGVSYNTAVGSGSLLHTTSGSENTALGYQALYNNTVGNNNTANGYQALYNNIQGDQNTASGFKALYNNDFGHFNTAYGDRVLYSNAIGEGNTASGFEALYLNISGNGNTASGYEALKNNKGDYNSAFGYQAMFSNGNGNRNTAIGIGALGNNQTGSYNSAIGYYATVTSGNLENATAIGSRSVVSTSNSMVLGSINGIQGATANTKVGIGTTSPLHLLHINANSSLDGTVQLCLQENNASDFARLKFTNSGVARYWDVAALNNATAANSRFNFYLDGVGDILSIHGDGNAILMGTLTQNSDARLKKNILPLSNSLTSIMALNGYQYQWKDKNRDDAPQIGLLAQEVQKLFPALVKEDDKGILSVNYTGLIPVMIEAMKEQQKTIDNQISKNEQLEKEIEHQKLKIDRQQIKIQQLNKLEIRVAELEKLLSKK